MKKPRSPGLRACQENAETIYCGMTPGSQPRSQPYSHSRATRPPRHAAHTRPCRQPRGHTANQQRRTHARQLGASAACCGQPGGQTDHKGKNKPAVCQHQLVTGLTPPSSADIHQSWSSYGAQRLSVGVKKGGWIRSPESPQDLFWSNPTRSALAQMKPNQQRNIQQRNIAEPTSHRVHLISPRVLVPHCMAS
ncbi:hypothetical protein HaLaN_10290 [Haematococcus lacustris]|uniref:Uncharacterized protein n=1 Tax=Haematococcus lacustris TaxID=44745 RepID=A0A699YVI0_HAELA|nr:hypothetical protein HaLaN_10290 [Haematococcus lacustris]